MAFLKKHRSEVSGMLLTYFDKEKHDRCQREEGREEGRLMTLVSLVKDDVIEIPEAARRAEMSEEDFSKLIK